MDSTYKPGLEAFVQAYGPALEKAVAEHPEDYGYPVTFVPIVLERMRKALQEGSFNHDGRAFKGACKALGIKHTRRAINAFLQGAPQV